MSEPKEEELLTVVIACDRKPHHKRRAKGEREAWAARWLVELWRAERFHPKDREFGASLAGQLECGKRKLSDKQWEAALTLVSRYQTFTSQAPDAEQLGLFGGIK